MKKIEKWETLSSEYLIRRPWLTARRDVVKLPDGTVYDEYYVLEYPTWINTIAITEDGDFVMVEQYRHGLDEISVELCAGVAEDGETPEAAARRELLEETGFGGGEWTLIDTLSANPGTTTNLTYCFLARGVRRLDGCQHLDATEDIAVRILTRDELYALLSRGGIRQALMAAPLWRYFATIE